MALKTPRQHRSFASRIPGVGPLADVISRVARAPGGFFVLLPVALFLDLFDAFDELALGPVGMVLSFVLESAFLLGLTGRTSYAFALAGLDLVPGLDVLPLATITLVRETFARRDRTRSAGSDPRAPVIDV